MDNASNHGNDETNTSTCSVISGVNFQTPEIQFSAYRETLIYFRSLQIMTCQILQFDITMSMEMKCLSPPLKNIHNICRCNRRMQKQDVTLEYEC